MRPGAASRRAVLAGSLALAACGPNAEAGDQAGRGATPPLSPLKEAATFPLGVAAMTGQLDDPQWAELVQTHFDRLTPEWEMKTEAFLGEGDRMDFSRADRLVDWASQRGLGVFGHTLIWYAQSAPRFERLDGRGQAFERAYRDYVDQIVRRYRGRVLAWDVVNEPVTDEGTALRDSLWSRNLGPVDHIRLAFEQAREADPQAVLFLNDYNLETNPRKFETFLRLIDDLLEAGAPISGLGTQTHVDCGLPAGAIARVVRELARFGLPVHVSEIDVSTASGPPARQGQVFAEAAQAMAALPEAQRFGVTVWGVRDGDSWLRRADWHRPPEPDRPLLFGDDGRPKAAAHDFRRALA